MEEKTYASDLAGHCNEPTAWQILKEVSTQLIEKGLCPINPFCIEIGDDGHFSLICPECLDHQSFEAPEFTNHQLNEPGVAWSLGATLFYIVMGCQVMNGKGGKGQRENSKLPYMRSEWPELSELVQRCLNYDPTCRPPLAHINEMAMRQHANCQEEIRRGPKLKKNVEKTNIDIGNDEKELSFWPENMQSSMSNP